MTLVSRFLTVPRLIMAAVVIALGLGFVAGNVLTAQGAPENSTVHACVNRYNGDMRMPRVEGQCASTEFAVSWESYDAADLDAEYVNEGQIDSITSAMILDGEVGTSDLADDSVTSAKILDGEIGTADLADDSVTSAKILDGEVGTSDLADDSVTTAKILDGDVGTADLADDSVTTAKILDGDVGTTDLADDSVTSAKILDGDVGTSDLADDSVTSAKILDGSITADELGTDSVGTDEIQTGAVTTVEILDGTISADDLGTDSVGSDEIQTGAVTTDEILDGTIATTDLDAGLQSDIANIQGHTIIESADVLIAAGAQASATASCPVGTVLLGGGGVSDTNIDVSLVSSYPDPTIPGDWTVLYSNNSAAGIVVNAFAVCANG